MLSLNKLLFRQSLLNNGYGIRFMSVVVDASKVVTPINKVLIANRGEIACRVMRTAKKRGVKTVAVYSEADRNSMHVAMADEAYLIGPAAAKDSYLRSDKILEVAKRTGAQAIHPGYGFLSENAGFADLCEKEGIIFIGPPSSAILAMGSKSASKDIMIRANVPTIPGYHGEDQEFETLRSEAEKIGYPVLIKAVMGGGGKGMRIVERPEDLEDGINSSKRESKASFGDDRVLVEKYLVHPRHVEIQVFADRHGNCVHLFERDCSVQRRHQKIIEEAPAPHLSEELRKKMGDAAVAAAKAVGYVGAGTVEFILSQDGSFYFMEMNTRLQVEHPITEMITKQDLVEWQLKVAESQPLPLGQNQLAIHGHAFEARIYAENPDSDFMPGTGKLLHLSTPEPSSTLRVETGVRQGDEVSVYYDPMIAKLVVWDTNREKALRYLRNALDEYHIVGLNTNISFLKRLSSHPAFQKGEVETGFIPIHRESLMAPQKAMSNDTLCLAVLSMILSENALNKSLNGVNGGVILSPWSASNAFRVNNVAERVIKFNVKDQKIQVPVTYNKDNSYTMTMPNGEKLTVSGSHLDAADQTLLKAYVADRFYPSVRAVKAKNSLFVFNDSQSYELELPIEVTSKGGDAASGSLLSPMPGKITKIMVAVGDKVKKGQPIILMEAMKMEHTIRAPQDGKVESLPFNVNEIVEDKKVLATIV
ncbi:methylcrotonyl-CoA carboxylase [Heterostelium album PN500]|uniref:Methylcrotonyl-CoA carboxylase n=1 Tax=Heterostelium pallidum (strain ATCC 26659 / Pp 5 / PN500) TaxID=670386 RepID=D3BHW3_HETP5|nr:methylcrotonyl-CoA carboxylase [Heterostelium album PN500]EFA78863.1 methylcrotonyl-CoA carboxylase [Heterostelium album PN500]|eukprot:XP_020430987.1 methylcrotonyl-CoA carboxylase [Heterostelium album PN500]